MSNLPNFNHPFDGSYDTELIPVFAQWVGSWRISLQRRALSAPQLSRAYDRAAPTWNRRLDRLGVPAAYAALLRGVLDGVTQTPDATPLRVLDCGIGTGALSVALARVLPAPFALDAIDISPRMLDRARANLRTVGVPVSLCHGDVGALPYDTGSFDLVMAGHVLEHIVDPGVAVAEMVRVLKPGGLFVACLTRRSPLGMLVHVRWRTHRVTAGQAEDLLRHCGLRDAHCVPAPRRSFFARASVACSGRKPGPN